MYEFSSFGLLNPNRRNAIEFIARPISLTRTIMTIHWNCCIFKNYDLLVLIKLINIEWLALEMPQTNEMMGNLSKFDEIVWTKLTSLSLFAIRCDAVQLKFQTYWNMLGMCWLS